MEFRMSKREYLINIAVITAVLCIMSRLFYGTFLATPLLIPVGILLFRQRKETVADKKKNTYETQFKDMLISLSDALTTGYSVENAMKESYKDLIPLYGYDSDICREMRLMLSHMKYNVNAEKAIAEFAQRSGLANAKMFSEIFSVAKRTGGNMTDIIKSVTDDIVLRETVREEIQVAINEKKTEQNVMTLVPMFLIVYVNVSSPGFLNIMYETMLGKVVMTLCIVCYVAAFVWGQKIVKMET